MDFLVARCTQSSIITPEASAGASETLLLQKTLDCLQQKQQLGKEAPFIFPQQQQREPASVFNSEMLPCYGEPSLVFWPFLAFWRIVRQVSIRGGGYGDFTFE